MWLASPLPGLLKMNTVVSEYRLPGNRLLRLVLGDLTQEAVDAIVNAANAQLAHGGGVAGAIVRRGGRQIQEESDAWVRQHGPVTHDKPAVTSGGKLLCRFVIHAVGPVWGEGEEDFKLAAAVRGALEVADERGLGRLAMPAISTGVFGFPKGRAAEVTAAAIEDYFHERTGSGLQEVRITLLDAATVGVFEEALKRRFGAAPARP